MTEPRRVDLLDRPDCLEDVFGLVEACIGRYPQGVRGFWREAVELRGNGTDEGEGDEATVTVLAPSRALQTLDLLKEETDPALSVYISFLASLSLAQGPSGDESDGGASLIHSYLANERTINSIAERRMHIDWTGIFALVRDYANSLSGVDEASSSKDDSSPAHPTMSSLAAEESTGYYYGVGSSESVPAAAPEQGGLSAQPSGGGAIQPTKPGLNEQSRTTLMALLALISNVASHSSCAREFILSLKIAAFEDAGTDGTLEILFALLAARETDPEIAGSAFTAIANLLRPGSGPIVERAANRAWELVEMCKFVPIQMLSQYSSHVGGTGPLPLGGGTAGSSTAAFPKNAEYGMVYQLEHVEMPSGTFPATEGFLFLLTTLVKCVGCPSKLGCEWRLRTGCQPYIEYVTDFVLPRATGMAKSVKAIPFRDASDKCRLIARSLEVIEAVLTRYVVPPAGPKVDFNTVKERFASDVKMASSDLGLSPIVGDIFVRVEDLQEEEAKDFVTDFQNVQVCWIIRPCDVIRIFHSAQRSDHFFSVKDRGATAEWDRPTRNARVSLWGTINSFVEDSRLRDFVRPAFLEQESALLCLGKCSFGKQRLERHINVQRRGQLKFACHLSVP